MKKIFKTLIAAGVTLSVGVIASRRDYWRSRGTHAAGDYSGELDGKFGDSPAYQLALNPSGNVIFTDPNRALRQFREEHAQAWKPLQEKYSLPGLRMDSCALYRTYQQYDKQQGSPADPLLSAFLQAFLNTMPQ